MLEKNLVEMWDSRAEAPKCGPRCGRDLDRRDDRGSPKATAGQSHSLRTFADREGDVGFSPPFGLNLDGWPSGLRRTIGNRVG